MQTLEKRVELAANPSVLVVLAKPVTGWDGGGTAPSTCGLPTVPNQLLPGAEAAPAAYTPDPADNGE